MEFACSTCVSHLEFYCMLLHSTYVFKNHAANLIIYMHITKAVSFQKLGGKPRITFRSPLSKQCIPWSDAAFCGVWSGSALFATVCQCPSPGFTDNPFYTITKTCLFKYNGNFTTKKWKFSDKNSDIFHISAQNRDCGYSFNYKKVGFKRVRLIYTCCRDDGTLTSQRQE